MYSSMKHYFSTFVLVFIGLFFVLPASAFAGEKIDAFEARITVKADASITVQETIRYDFGSDERHGIFREIPKTFIDTRGDEHRLELAVLSVQDDTGNAYPWVRADTSSLFRIQIGDPNKTIQGAHVYSIVYAVKNAISFLETSDEIYWNVTGNQWPIPIVTAFASVTLPGSFNESELPIGCYRGAQGDSTPCQKMMLVPQSVSMASTTQPSVTKSYHVAAFADAGLFANQGLTVAVGFPKGVVVEQKSLWKTVVRWIKRHLFQVDVVLGATTVALTALFCFMQWSKFGRDPRKGVIVPEYDAPEDICSLEAGYLLNLKIKQSDIGAAIISLAVKGALRIEENEEKTLPILRNKNYRLVRLSTPLGGKLSDIESYVCDSLFSSAVGAKNGVLLVADINVMAMIVSFSETQERVARTLFKKKYFTRNPRNMSLSLIAPIPVFFLIALCISYFSMVQLLWSWVGLGIAFVIAVVFVRLMPQMTKEGTLVRDRLLGLRRYIEVAEKERIEFHNAPEKTPELFEKLLPYAMIFGLADIWVNEFADIMKEPPQWYSGSAHAWALGSFMQDVNGFSTSFTSAATPSRSASSGGGFSGGGGGGGGGGSW